MVADIVKRKEMAMVNTYFRKREGHGITYKSGHRLYRKHKVKSERESCLQSGDKDNVARQYWIWKLR